jgi:hypothetical protein
MVPYHLSVSFCAQIQHRPFHHVRVNAFFQKNENQHKKQQQRPNVVLLSKLT